MLIKISLLFEKAIKPLLRRKPLEKEFTGETRLLRCLTTFDLTALGVGSTLGLGIYVLAGHVAYKLAGPSVVLSFIIAAVASVFAGLCYAEFGARVPRAGSAYVYSYVTVGEFMAFVIGWNLILEYVIGAASVARGYSSYIDSLCSYKMSRYFKSTIPLNIPGTASYIDIFAFSLTMVLSVLQAVGVKESSRLTTLFTVVNLYAVLFVIVAGAFQINPSNWSIPVNNVPPGFGAGGFFPFGFQGMMKGAATCFYGFVGFDAIACMSEEAKEPHKSIPISILVSLFLIMLAYLGVSCISTLVAPYWTLGSTAPLIDLFSTNRDWLGSRYIVAFGAMTSLLSALLGALFPLPRVLFAMSSDGLIPSIFGLTSGPNRLPIFATLFSGLFSSLMASIFDIDELTDMMSIGTLMAYSLVAISVLILRYHHDLSNATELFTNNGVYGIDQNLSGCEIAHNPSYTSLLFNSQGYSVPNKMTSRVSSFLIFALSLLCLTVDGLLVNLYTDLLNCSKVTCLLVTINFTLILIFSFALSRQPQSTANLYFKVPLIPWIPITSVLFNFYLMYNLNRITWLRFLVWMAFGLTTYFLYSLKNSRGYLTNQEINKSQKVESNDSFDDKPNVGMCSPPKISSNCLNNFYSDKINSSI